MRKILSIAANVWRLEFADRSNWLFFIALPILFTAILGSVGGGGGRETRLPLLVVDEDRSDLSRDLVARLESLGAVHVLLKERADADRAFVNDEAQGLLTIPAGFGERLLGGQSVELPLRRDTSSTTVLALEQAVAAASSGISNAVAAARAAVTEAERVRPFTDEAARRAYFEGSLSAARAYLADPPARVESVSPQQGARQTLNGTEQSSAGQLVTWVLINLLAAAEILVAERVEGTLRRLVITPTHKFAILAGKVIGRYSMGVVQMALLIGFGLFVLGVNWGQSPLALALVAGAFGLAAVAIGIFLATLFKSRGQAVGTVIFTGMLLSALGGAWWPLEITPEAYQTVAQAFPTTWAMRGFTDVIIRGQGVAGVLPEVGVLLGFAAVFFALGVWRFRYE